MTRLLRLDASGQGWKETKVGFSYQNEEEAKFVLQLLRAFVAECKPGRISVGIISPWLAVALYLAPLGRGTRPK